ncbi:uncharacterized protein LOC123872132 [Maniola jurtina]|uniref:uncharacterized protein LOC123872132 n=1 Tax=Maniola jurtina TaxID=191418 RepID=UPI001E687A9D|nr:uncharacterized protein LOC123872132 [Maniola jurtina]
MSEELHDQIKELQKQLGNLQTQPPAVNGIAVKLPTFWQDKPVIWFAQAEAQFEIAGIKQDSTKYGYVLSMLDERKAEEVEDILANPPENNKYETLKAELIARFSASKEQRVRKLLGEVQLGDRKPSAFLRHLKSLAGSTCKDDGIIRELWMRRLPQEVQRILIAQLDLPLDKVAEIADAIVEAPSSSFLPSTVSAAAVPSEMEMLKQQMDILMKKMDELSREHRSGSRSRSQAQRQRSSSRSGTRACWYHKKFGTKATKCTSPCAWIPERGNEPGNQ